jgi:gliding motility-associated-like protein
VTVIDNGSSCTSTTVVIVNALPAVIGGNNQVVCQGGSIILSGSGAQTYSWNNSVANGASFVPASTQTYTVTGMDANGCQNTAQVVVTVNSLPTVNAGADQTVCQGGSITLSGSGAQTYNWNNSVNNGISFVPGLTQTYIVTGTDANGCQGTDQVVVTVSPLPNVNAGADQSLCFGDAITLSASGAQIYVWTNGVNNGVSFVPGSTQIYTVTGTDANGCQNTDQVLVTVNPAPIVNAGTDQAVCQGGSITLSGSGVQSYTWNNGVTNGVSFVPGSTQTYIVTGTSQTGCQGTDQVVVTVNPLPNVNAGADQSLCFGDAITLSASGAQTYVWTNGVNDGISFVPGSTQTYIVTGTDANGCQNTDQIMVVVVSYPVSNLSSDVNSGNPVLTVNFDNNSTNAGSFHWNFGNGQGYEIQTHAGQQVAYNNPGEYIVVLTAMNGSCADTDTLKIQVLPFPDPVVVIPNIFTPNGDHNNDQFFISVDNVKTVKVTIMNRWGERMYEYEGIQGAWDGTVNGNPASDGVYFFKYEIEGLNGTVLKGQGNIQLIR